jgi:FixJ family two-component response regulator
VSSVAPTVAIVDDDASVCVGVQRLLQSEGWRTATYTSGLAFLESLERAVPACVVLDVSMPAMSGFDVLAALRARGSRMPVVFISAEVKFQREAEDLAQGCAFLLKPFDGHVLLATLRSALA